MTDPAQWYVDADREPVDFDTAIVDNVATVTIRRVARDRSGSLLTTLWARQGVAVRPFQQQQARDTASAEPVPDEPTPDPMPETPPGAGGGVDWGFRYSDSGDFHFTTTGDADGNGDRYPAVDNVTRTWVDDAASDLSPVGGPNPVRVLRITKSGLYRVSVNGRVSADGDGWTDVSGGVEVYLNIVNDDAYGGQVGDRLSFQVDSNTNTAGPQEFTDPTLVPLDAGALVFPRIYTYGGWEPAGQTVEYRGTVRLTRIASDA